MNYSRQPLYRTTVTADAVFLRDPREGLGRPLAICVCLCCCVWLVGCSHREAPSEQPVSTELGDGASEQQPVAALPARPDSPFLNTAADVQYVGSDACRDCHDDVHGAFVQTRHSRALSVADQENAPDARIRHEKSGYEYTTRTTDDGRLEQTETVLLGDQQKTSREVMIDYVVGSGRFGKSYLTQLDGFLVQSPLTWYSDREEWDMSPGFDSPAQFSFRRAVSAKCLYCHAGQVEVLRENAYRSTIHEQFVSCERCHGPGELHIQKHLHADDNVTGRDEIESSFDDTIVNPAHLARDLQEGICQQCHLQADAQVAVRGYDFDDFRPGLPIQSFRQDYRFGQSDDDMTVVGHVEQMHRSRCFTETNTLTCTTCHHPHPGDPPMETLSAYRQKCLQCHTDDSCGELPELRHSEAQNQCTVCHMPSTPTEVPHVAFTHHRIGIHRSGEVNSGVADSSVKSLLPLLDDSSLTEADRSRCVGLGALRVFLGNAAATNSQTLRIAQESLQKAWDLGARDAEVAAGMATIAFEVGWSEKIEQWTQLALQLDQTASEARSTALSLLSELQFRRGEYDQAFLGFQELTSIRRDARAWFFRGVSAQNLNDTAEAVMSLQKSVEINPRNHAAHVALTALFELKGDQRLRDHHKQMVEDLVRSTQ
ncbi:MAG: cytochrome c3 family protein [Fuerstiella sp.]|nr:cytochrome c3 family protein [Fuerstiella sp.]